MISGQLGWVSGGRQSVCTVLPGIEEITQNAGVLGRPLHHHHPCRGRHMSHSAASEGEDDGCPPGQAGAIPGGFSERVALRSEQCNGWAAYIIGTDARFLPDCDVCALL
jgi:hypothetical protein